MMPQLCPSRFLGWHAFLCNFEGHFLLREWAHCIDISTRTKSGSRLLTNQKSSNFHDSFGPEKGCPKFYVFDITRLPIVIENCVKTALIVQNLAHRMMQSLSQWTTWFKSYSWKSTFDLDRDSVSSNCKTRIKCAREFVFHWGWAYANRFVRREGRSSVTGLFA